MFSKRIFFLALAAILTAAGVICMSRKKQDDPLSKNEPEGEDEANSEDKKDSPEANLCEEQTTSSQQEVDTNDSIVEKVNQSEDAILKSWEQDINDLKVSWREHPSAEKFPSLRMVLDYAVTCGLASGGMFMEKFNATRPVASTMLELLTKHHIVPQPEHLRMKRIVNLTADIWAKLKERIDFDGE